VAVTSRPVGAFDDPAGAVKRGDLNERALRSSRAIASAIAYDGRDPIVCVAILRVSVPQGVLVAHAI
jgi:hypothetical protein